MKLIARIVPLVAAALLFSACRVSDDRSAPAEVAETAITPILGTADAVDTHSFARPLEARVAHIALDLDVDFDARRIGGTATLDLVRKPDARQVVLDDNGLEIRTIKDGSGNVLPFTVGSRDPNLGAPLNPRRADPCARETR